MLTVLGLGLIGVLKTKFGNDRQMVKILDGSVLLKRQIKAKQDASSDGNLIDTSKSILHYAGGYADLLRRIRGRSIEQPQSIESVDGEKSFSLRQRELAYLRKSRKTCISIYLCKINLLWRRGFSYGFLTSISLNDIDILSDLNAVIQRDYERGNITDCQVSAMRGKLMALFERQASNDVTPEKLPLEVWPEDKEPGEKAIEFLRRVWGKGDDNIKFQKSDIRSKNFPLYQALTTYFRRPHTKTSLDSWWQDSPIRSKQEIDSELQRLNIKKPEDAFQRGLEVSEAHRLYNASLRRQQK